jgi:hypothetical protein
MSTSFAFTLALGGLACEKGGEGGGESNAPEAAVPADPIDAATDMLVTKLQAGDRDGLLEQSVSPLVEDLSPLAFEDISKTVAWLGYMSSKTARSDVPIEGGTRRSYSMEFEKGDEVTLEVSVVDGKVMGFHFAGDDFFKAEHGVIADQFRQFKVYDFWFEDGEGNRLTDVESLPGPTIRYRLVVGGMEAFGGKHHIGVEKMLQDSSGKELFKEPVAYDTEFKENAEGIPRGEIGGDLDVPGPGEYELVLLLEDDIAAIDAEYRTRFKVVK